MIDSILFALWFFLPAGFANGAPVVANNIPKIKDFSSPMDFNKTYRGIRIFGDHKTFRGLISGVFTAVVVILMQMLLFNSFQSIQELVDGRVDYASVSTVVMGAALGLGALTGDAVKSFFKRQIGIKPGKSWFPFDQTDFIVGGLIFTVPFVSFSLLTYATIFIVMALLHPVINLSGWLLHLKDKPF